MDRHRYLRAPVPLAYAAFVLVGLGAGVSGVLLPAQISDYDVDKATIGLTFFAGSAGFFLAGVTAGPLIHRFGSRLTLALSGGLYVVAGLFIATRPPFVAFLLAQVLIGYGTGALESVLNAYLAGLPKAATLLNRLHAFFGVGALLGPLLATWMLGFASWTAVWLALALAGVPLVIGFALAYPGTDPLPGASAEPADGPGRGALLPAALREPGVLLGSALLALYVGLELGVGNWGFSYLVEERGQGDLIAGYTVSGYWLGLTLGRFLISPIANRIGMTAIGMVYACLGGVGFAGLLAWLSPGAGAASVGLLLLGFFLGPIFPTTMAVMPEVIEARLVPTAMGVLNAGSVVGGAALPWLAGTLAQSEGPWTLLPFVLVLTACQLVVWRSIAARVRAGRVPPASAQAAGSLP
ncbi:MAG TPA: MFS transporter [Micromonosporaceae bacterium]|nr:MFS transporter [Micromonosporaceae bacterium]